MHSISTARAPSGPAEGALLDRKLIGDIAGNFFVAKYQRGYRWGTLEVKQLLTDLWESNGRDYNLQPIVLKRRSEGEWELVDGQQRLTTLYLVLRFMQRERLKNIEPTYSIQYETRHDSQSYLQELDEARKDHNIDFFHLHAAYDCIRAWFDGWGSKRQYAADKLYMFLCERVHVIWYEAPPGLDSSTLFTRLNIGRIPLTDAELLKALLLSRSRGGPGLADRAYEIAAQWDSIERDLRHPDVWAFLTDASGEDCPTRITLLLDTVAGGPRGRDRPRYYTFEELRERMAKTSPQAVWNEVVDLHALVLGWFESRSLHHKIGYLVALGHHFADLVQLAARRRKSSFEAALDERIRDELDAGPSDVAALSYDSAPDECERLLLLMNVETIRRQRDSAERFSFRRYREDRWSLEHIHAQHAESLTKAEQWKEWLRLHREALGGLPSDEHRERREALIAKIDAAQNRVDRQTFQALASEVADVFTLADTAGASNIHSVHSISNLALLSTIDNSALSNAVFEVKRRKILELDRHGSYVPICTRHVSLKYHSDAGAHQIHFWGTQDRESYLRAMLEVVNPYLKREAEDAS